MGSQLNLNPYAGKKFNEARVHDYLYDPIFTLPTAKDHAKHALIASVKTAQYEVAPIFPYMFSDMPNYPRQQIVLRNSSYEPQNINRKWENSQKLQDVALQCKTVDVFGGDRSKFFISPLISRAPNVIDKEKETPLKLKMGSSKPRTKGTQTLYRESSAQTSPWKPPDYVVMDDSDPEILKLNFLKENLPAGVHEVEIIHRARKKRAWEKLLPEIEDAASLEKRRQILEAIETDEWAFREQEISHIQNLRMELLEKMLQEILDESAYRTESKLNRITTRLHKEREKKLAKLHHKKERELRRLYRNHYGVNTKYHKVNVIDEHADFASEVYAPLMRFGEHPKRWHENITQSHYEPLLMDIEYMSTLPRWLAMGRQIKEDSIKLPGRRLCIRETKWTEPVLKQLHEELTGLRTSTKFKCTLRKRKIKQEELDETAFVEALPDSDMLENNYILMIQSIIRGRATQTLIYEGRDRCRELIQELQSTHVLVMAQTEQANEKRLEVVHQQRQYEIQTNRMKQLEESLDKLQGAVAGTMLTFLNKELVRLLDERKAHALALLYERERRDTEALEAGRRQVEERRRKEHDEMFKQVIKVHQDTVDLYLRDIVAEGVEHVSEKEAKDYVKKLADKIEEDFKEEPKTFIEKEEIIADLICHFVIPEVEKQRVRERVKLRQQKHLRCAHKAIFNKFERLPAIVDDDTSEALTDKSEESIKLPTLSSTQDAVPELEETEIMCEMYNEGEESEASTI